jgi:hypothetical protein
LLHIENSSAGDYDGYGGPLWRSNCRYDEEEDGDSRTNDEEDGDSRTDDEFRVAGVFDRSLTLSDWRRGEGGVASLGALPSNEGEVCPPDALVDMDTDEQHFQEAIGNGGASFERSVQQAALVLWPHATKLRLIARAGLAASLPALGGMRGAWIDGGAEPGHAHCHAAHALAVEMLACLPGKAARRAHNGPSAESAAHWTWRRLPTGETRPARAAAANIAWPWAASCKEPTRWLGASKLAKMSDATSRTQPVRGGATLTAAPSARTARM